MKKTVFNLGHLERLGDLRHLEHLEDLSHLDQLDHLGRLCHYWSHELMTKFFQTP